MKRKLCFLFVLPLLITACEAILDGGIREEYQGVVLPELENGGKEMNALLDLAESQNGPIDDALFVQALKESVFVCTDRYILKDDKWRWALNLIGGSATGAVMMEGDKFYTIHDGISEADPKGPAPVVYLKGLGYKGWYNANPWSYDAETNTLTTKANDFTLTAKVLYFGMGKAVLEGFVVGVANPVAYKNELYLFEFRDIREEFLDKRLSAEEYFNAWEAHCKAEGIKNEFDLSYFTTIY